MIEGYLGDGTRWGCRFTFHLARNPSFPFERWPGLGLERGSGVPFLLGRADRLPLVQLGAGRERAEKGTPVLYVAGDALGGEGRQWWTGWGLFAGSDLAALPRDLRGTGLARHVLSTFGPRAWICDVDTVLGVRTPEEMIAAQRSVLAKDADGLLLGVREEEGLWVSRQARVSPAAELSPPLYVGPNCLIGPGTRLGPHVAVGEGSIIDSQADISHAAVLAGSYVGKAMSLHRVVVDRDLAVYAGDNSSRVCTDPLALGSVARTSPGSLAREGGRRLLALVLLVVSVPVLLGTALALALFRRGRVVHTRTVVRLPVPHAESPWPTYRLFRFAPPAWCERGEEGRPGLGHLFLHWLPGLVNVLRGEVHFVGLAPRSPQQVANLSPEWRSVYLQAKGGLMSPPPLGGREPNLDDQFATDASYVANLSVWQDVRVVAAYFLEILLGPLKRLGPVFPYRLSRKGGNENGGEKGPGLSGYRTDPAAPGQVNGAAPHTLPPGAAALFSQPFHGDETRKEPRSRGS